MRYYNQWAGNPAGERENPEQCAASVSDTGRGMLSWQCSRKRGHGKDGLLCKQHATIEATPGRFIYIPRDKGSDR
jgi:hypothetical protein